MAIQILGDGAPEGTSVTKSATELAGFHGVAVVQAASVASVATLATSSTDGPIVVALNGTMEALNAVIVALRGKGILSET